MTFQSLVCDWPERSWTHILEVYDRPGTKELCLRLQDDHAVCVPAILCLLALVAEGRCVSAEHWSQIELQSDKWCSNVIDPLRSARRSVKRSAGCLGDARLYEQLKTVELEAERQMMAVISTELMIVSALRVAKSEESLKAELTFFPDSVRQLIGELFLQFDRSFSV